MTTGDPDPTTRLTPHDPGNTGWTVRHGPLTPEQLVEGVTAIAERHQMHMSRIDAQTLVLTHAPSDSPGRSRREADEIRVRWRRHTPPAPETLAHAVPDSIEILIEHPPGTVPTAELLAWLEPALNRFSSTERAHITASMPLLMAAAPGCAPLSEWALIVRDHYTENTLGFIYALRDAGVPAQWIVAYAKGDRTLRRDRIHATLLDMGCGSSTLDNTAINAPASHSADLAAARRDVDAFIDAAHAAGRPVMVIDDGGLIAQGYASTASPRRVDAAVELTVSGLKRIHAVGDLAIPVLDMARSQLKTRLGYPEIADSCLRRLRALLPGVKLIGRPVLVIGHGALGARVARALADLGCQVHIVDPDPLARIDAAEAGHCAHTHLAGALDHTRPVVIVGTCGAAAVTVDDFTLLPDGVYLAPFATKDFAALCTGAPGVRESVTVPGIGLRHRLDTGHGTTIEVTLLGDGRSLNLFESDAIPSQGYDAYRAGTLLAAATLAQRHKDLAAGVHTRLVDDIIRQSGLYESYYATYLDASPEARRAAPQPPAAPEPGSAAPPVQAKLPRRRNAASVCVVGFGKIGRLHAEILADQGVNLTIIDPKHQDLPQTHRTFTAGVDDLPPQIRADVDLWSVCTPTADHLPVLKSILLRDPHARVLLEKPACLGHEIDAFQHLLNTNAQARVVVTDQYRHARVVDRLQALMRYYEPAQPPSHVAVTFVKDRSGDIALGRFVDRSYGVLGYEWLHMLTILDRVLPAPAAAAYWASDPAVADLWPTYHRDLFVSACIERSHLVLPDGPLHVDLTSSINTPTLALTPYAPQRTTRTSHPQARPTSDSIAPGTHPRALGHPPTPSPDPHRQLSISAGCSRFTAHFDPVAICGQPARRNRHLITVERNGALVHEELVHDSPLHTAVHTATAALLGDAPIPPPDLTTLRRIAALAELLRDHQPEHRDTPAGADTITAATGLINERTHG